METLISYYKRLEDAIQISEKDILKLKELEPDASSTDEEKMILDNLAAAQSLSLYFLTPFQRFISVHHRYSPTFEYIDKCMEDTTDAHAPHFLAHEVFDILCACSDKVSSYVISKIPFTISVYESLVKALEEQDSETFCRTWSSAPISIPQNITNVLLVLKFWCTELMEKDIKENTGDDLSLYSDYLQKTILPYKLDIDCSSPEERFAKNFLNKQLDSITEWADCLKELDKQLDFDDEFSVELSKSFLQKVERVAFAIYVLNSAFDFSRKELEILEKIKSRPQVAEYYKRWDEELQEIEDELKNEMCVKGEYNTDYKKYDACLKKGIDPKIDSSEYYGGNLKFFTNGVLSSVIENFDLKEYLKKKDFSLFVYRMTGCGKPNHIIGNNKIAWCKDLTGDRMKEGYKELLSLCLILSSTIDYQKISKFFDLEDENYFHKKNLSQQALDNFYLAVTGKKNTSYFIK